MLQHILLQENFKGIQHLGIPVTNLKNSVDFYSLLGFRRILTSFVSVPIENDVIHVAMMEQKGIIIELYQVTVKAMEELRNRRDGPIDHIAFDVSDVEKAFCELRDAGFIINEEKPVFLNFWQKGCKYFTIRGPDGEKLEFNEIIT